MHKNRRWNNQFSSAFARIRVTASKSKLSSKTLLGIIVAGTAVGGSVVSAATKTTTVSSPDGKVQASVTIETPEDTTKEPAIESTQVPQSPPTPASTQKTNRSEHRSTTTTRTTSSSAGETSSSSTMIMTSEGNSSATSFSSSTNISTQMHSSNQSGFNQRTEVNIQHSN